MRGEKKQAKNLYNDIKFWEGELSVLMVDIYN